MHCVHYEQAFIIALIMIMLTRFAEADALHAVRLRVPGSFIRVDCFQFNSQPPRLTSWPSSPSPAWRSSTSGAAPSSPSTWSSSTTSSQGCSQKTNCLSFLSGTRCSTLLYKHHKNRNPLYVKANYLIRLKTLHCWSFSAPLVSAHCFPAFTLSAQ